MKMKSDVFILVREKPYLFFFQCRFLAGYLLESQRQKKESFEPFLKRIPLDTWILCKRRSWFCSSKLWERGRHIIVTKRKNSTPNLCTRGAKKRCICFSFPLSNIRPWSLIFWGPNPHVVSLIWTWSLIFFWDQRPIWSLIITWSLINFSGMKKLFYLRIIFTQGKHETTIIGIFQWTWDW